MDMYPKYTSPFGYQTGVGGIDTYGVNHNNFSLRDELEYQFARQKRENQLMQQYNNQGITENYPQYGTNFWGNSANNYGFGNSNISANIENMQNNTTPIPMATATPQQQAQQQPAPSTWDTVKQLGNNFADATEAGVVGYATGASLGNFDEAMGGAATAFGVDYKGARDAVRQLQNNLSQQHPWAYGVGEFAGAMTTPMHLAKDTTFANKALNAATDTLNASAGYAENWNDFAANLVVNGIANTLGLGLERLPIGRAFNSNTGKQLLSNGFKFARQGINSSADKIKNMYYKNEEKYY